MKEKVKKRNSPTLSESHWAVMSLILRNNEKAVTIISSANEQAVVTPKSLKRDLYEFYGF